MKNMKKILSVLLCIVLVFSLGSVGLSVVAVTDKCNCGVTPIIYVKGRTNIYKDRFDERNEENMAETNFSGGTDSIIEASSNIIPAFAKALLTDEWDEYCDILFEEITPIYDGYKLNNDGEKDEGNTSGIDPYWDVDTFLERYKSWNVRHSHTARAGYDTQYIQFQYDMRLDPCVNAADFKIFVDGIKELTGHDKVNIICRCEGNVIVNAYFNLYKEEAKNSVESVVMYNSIAMGSEIADEVYSNKVDLDAKSLNRFINTFLDTSPVLDFVKATVNLATFAGIVGGGTDFIMNIYDKISLNLMPRLIREIFGSCPGWWGMVSPEAYEEAKQFVLLNDNEDGKFDKLIEKIDNYNYNYKVNARGILEEMQESGVKVHIITKYGSQMYPVIENHDILGDGVVSLYKQTFGGATTSEIDTTLSDEYIQQRIDGGYDDYISADKKVDGSTAAFPEHTWYIKGLDHHSYAWVVEDLMIDIFSYDGYATVNDLGDEYSQFMLYEDPENIKHGGPLATLTPLTQENAEKTKDTTNTTSRFAALIKFLSTLLNLLASLFNKA